MCYLAVQQGHLAKQYLLPPYYSQHYHTSKRMMTYRKDGRKTVNDPRGQIDISHTKNTFHVSILLLNYN